MSLALVIAIILLLIVLAGIFSYRVNALYQNAGSLIAAIAALLLFLLAINVIHF